MPARQPLPTRPVGRPQGDVAQALLCAAQERPGTVRELALRAQVGYRVARYTASRLLERGDLLPVLQARPAVLAARSSAMVCLLEGAPAQVAGLAEVLRAA